MNLSPNTQAILLLTSYLGKSSSDATKPLTNLEWGRFAFWLKDKGLTPSRLLQDDGSLLEGWSDKTISAERISLLTKRGHALALAVEKWHRAGLWIMTRADSDYPVRLKNLLKTNSPPVLFGCGNRALLSIGGLAVIGSRNANESDLKFTMNVGEKAARNNIAIVSGGARGVDEAAMTGAMNSGGAVIGVVADSLLRKVTSKKWREGLMSGQVVLVSPFHPEAGFNAGNAMSRNKYIYCLAESSLVIHSGTKGGTLSGAEENLKNKWVPLWVKPTSDKDAANGMLVSKGGRWIDGEAVSVDVASLFLGGPDGEQDNLRVQGEMFDDVKFSRSPANLDDQSINGIAPSAMLKIDAEDPKIAGSEIESNPSDVNFYRIFTEQLSIYASTPVSVDDIVAKSSLQKGQVNVWLKQAVADGILIKLKGPVRYKYDEQN